MCVPGCWYGRDAELVKLMGPQLELVLPVLDEKSRRLVLAAVGRAAGDGGITAVAKATGACWQTVAAGSRSWSPVRLRRRPGPRAGCGRPGLAGTDRGWCRRAGPGGGLGPGGPGVAAAVDDEEREELAGRAGASGAPVQPADGRRLLHEEGFSTQANAKVTEGRGTGRDAQFRYIAARAKEHLAGGQAVISVDAKKKEEAGEYAQAGREWRPAGDPVKVRGHSFADQDGGHAIPYGVYDVAASTGFVNVGTDHNTAALAVESSAAGGPGRPGRLPGCGRGAGVLRRRRVQRLAQPGWKAGLAQFAQDSGLEITVCHFPPGTSKWNKCA